MRSFSHLGLNAPALVAALGAVLATLAAPTPASAGEGFDARAVQVSFSEADVSFGPVALAASAFENAARTVERSSALLAPFASPLVSDAPAEHTATHAPIPFATGGANDATTDANTDTAAGSASRANVDAASVSGFALDDSVLSRQRGSGLGAMTVAATPGTTQGAGYVTLWDEIAPPAPMPVPVDAGRSAQSNIVTYTRK